MLLMSVVGLLRRSTFILVAGPAAANKFGLWLTFLDEAEYRSYDSD